MQINKVNYLCDLMLIVKMYRLPTQCILSKGSLSDHLKDNMSNKILVFCKIMLSIKVMHGNCHFNKGLLSLTFGLKCFCYLLCRFKICQQISMKHQNMNIGYLADNMCHFLCKMYYIRQMQIG